MAITLLIKMIIGSAVALGSTVTTLGIVYKDEVLNWFAPEVAPVDSDVVKTTITGSDDETPKTDPAKQASGETDVGESLDENSVAEESDDSQAKLSAQTKNEGVGDLGSSSGEQSEEDSTVEAGLLADVSSPQTTINAWGGGSGGVGAQ